MRDDVFMHDDSVASVCLHKRPRFACIAIEEPRDGEYPTRGAAIDIYVSEMTARTLLAALERALQEPEQSLTYGALGAGKTLVGDPIAERTS